MNRRHFLPALAVTALAGLTGVVTACGGDGSSTPPATVPAGALEVISGPGLHLDKSEYTIAATNGSVTIAYVNHDTQRHTLVVVNQDKIIEGTKLEVQKRNAVSVGTFQLTAGTYTIFCDVPGHTSSMKATLIVT